MKVKRKRPITGVKKNVMKSVGMGENRINISTNMENKNKKLGQNKNQVVKFPLKNQEKINLKTQEKINSNKSTGKNKVQKINSLKKVEKKETVVKPKTDEENIEEESQKTKKPKRRNNRNFKFTSEKMELTAILNQETEGRTTHRDERTLYVRFPSSLSVRDKSYLEPMVPSAVDIRFPRLSPGSFAKFCYVEFETEEETMKMKENFKTIKIKDEAFYADYVGKKSKAYNEKEPRTVDPLRLYVGGLPKGIQAGVIRAAFPTATRMLYRKASHKFSVSHAYLVYETHEDALNVFNSSKDLKILGKEVIVMFATYKNIASKNEEQSATPAAKKQKMEDVKMQKGNEDGEESEEDEEG